MTAIRADVTSPVDWDRVVETILKQSGRIDILVNNAGGGIRIAPTEDQTDESIADTPATWYGGTLTIVASSSPAPMNSTDPRM